MLKGKITRHEAGEFVTSGIYWNRKSWDLTAIGEEGGILPTENDSRYYYQLPLLLVMALAPLAGLAFILFSPWQFRHGRLLIPAPSRPRASSPDQNSGRRDTPVGR
jgi:hypothetical protein